MCLFNSKKINLFLLAFDKKLFKKICKNNKQIKDKVCYNSARPSVRSDCHC
jgi:hypothetical protein